jgi:hypothetical protein
MDLEVMMAITAVFYFKTDHECYISHFITCCEMLTCVCVHYHC